jgi:hypothetical protein
MQRRKQQSEDPEAERRRTLKNNFSRLVPENTNKPEPREIKSV